MCVNFSVRRAQRAPYDWDNLINRLITQTYPPKQAGGVIELAQQHRKMQWSSKSWFISSHFKMSSVKRITTNVLQTSIKNIVYWFCLWDNFFNICVPCTWLASWLLALTPCWPVNAMFAIWCVAEKKKNNNKNKEQPHGTEHAAASVTTQSENKSKKFTQEFAWTWDLFSLSSMKMSLSELVMLLLRLRPKIHSIQFWCCPTR